jgi:hypothetical protein
LFRISSGKTFDAESLPPDIRWQNILTGIFFRIACGVGWNILWI